MANYGEDYKSIAMVSGADLSGSEYLAVVQQADEQVEVAGAGDKILGFITASGSVALPTAAGEDVSVAYSGLCRAIAGATISTPGPVQIDAAGKVIAQAAGGNGLDIGWILSAAAANDVVIVHKY